MPAALKKMHDRENGFTLVELLIVVLIIGILAAVAIPIYLGIQQQGYKAAVRSDVNLSVKRVQVALTEGKSVTDVKANQSAYTQKSVKGEVVELRASSTAGAGDSDFSLSGIVTTGSTPAGPINYGYFYDSVTGKFTESDDAVALGSSTPSIVITTGTLPNATVGTAYTATVASTVVKPNGATQYAATGLPTGWSIDQNTGAISAPAGAVTTPTALSITVTATNGAVSANRNYTVNVYDKARISTTTLPAARKGQAYDQTLTFSGNPAPTFSVTTGSLPTGLNFDTALGRIYGTPTVSGQVSFTITANNAGGSDAKAYSITVNEPAAIATTTLPDAKVGTAYNQALSTSGYPAATFTATNLPSGLSMNSSTGAITGTSADLSGNSYTVAVTADNGVGSPATRNLTLINNEAPSVKLVNARSGARGSSYSDKLVNPGYTVGGTTISGGTGMPAGTSMNNTGFMTGTVSNTAAMQEYWFDVTATNSAGSITQGYNIVILDGTYAVANAGAFPDSANNGPALITQQCGYWNNQADGCYQWVVSGVWFRTPASTGKGGYYLTYNVIRRVWAPSGYENGTYGWPIAAPVFNPNGTVSQAFERGTITVSSKGIPGSY